MLPNIYNDSFITRAVVSDAKRDTILPSKLPSLYLVFEDSVYTFMKAICKNYHGALWDFVELSNGGFYMLPRLNATAQICIPFGNDFEGDLSWDAAGVIATLMAYCQLSEINGSLLQHHQRLLDYIDQHPEAVKIYRAID